MPCTYTGSLEGDAALAAKEALDDMTDRLCRTLGCIEMNDRHGVHTEITDLPKDIQRWWARHKREDASRERKKGKSHGR